MDIIIVFIAVTIAAFASFEIYFTEMPKLDSNALSQMDVYSSFGDEHLTQNESPTLSNASAVSPYLLALKKLTEERNI